MFRPVGYYYFSMLIWAFLLLCSSVAIQATGNRHLTSLVPPTPLLLPYHSGPLLTGNSRSPLLVNLLWYGSFTPSQRSIVTDFFASFDNPMRSSHAPSKPTRGGHRASKPIGGDHVAPSVSSWWQVAASYVDKSNASVANVVKLGTQISDTSYSLGKSLKRVHIHTLVVKALKNKAFPVKGSGTNLYFVLTASDVYVERFCMNSCGFHDYIRPPSATNARYRTFPFAWVGNSATQCPGLCAWPFAVPQFGPPNPPLVPPNRDVGMDGMIINIATILAGVATNPYGTGYFQGDASAPLEAATACAGTFGPGAYPGYPGDLQVDKSTKASFNALGIHQREYLLPALYSPTTHTCTTPH